MMTDKTVVAVLSQRRDPTADFLIAAMQKRTIPVVRFDTGDFPSSITLDASLDHHGGSWNGSFWYQDEKVPLGSIKSIWCRRPTHYRVGDGAPPSVKDFAEDEASKGFGGILRSLDCFWVSSLDAVRSANFKPLQLRVAHQCGLRVPRTLVTNDPASVLRFFEECNGNMVCKTLHSGFIPVSGNDYDAIYTSKVTHHHLEDVHRVRYTAHLFQEYISKLVELRITVIGTSVLAVEIHSQHSERTRTDWRAFYPDLHYSEHKLPREIERACLDLVCRLNLVYGCIDMIVTPSSEYIFLEINPNGQYLWLERETGLPFTNILIDVLIQGKDGSR